MTNWGEPIPGRIIRPREEPRRIAIHEAGHAVVAVIHGVPLDVCEMRDSADRLGFARIKIGDASPEVAIQIMCGGLVAEALAFGDFTKENTKHDRQIAERVAAKAGIRDIRPLRDKVAWGLRKRWACVEAVAAALLEHGSVPGEKVILLMQEAWTENRTPPAVDLVFPQGPPTIQGAQEKGMRAERRRRDRQDRKRGR